MAFGRCLRDQKFAQPARIRRTMQAGVFVDFWGIVAPINRLIYVADNKLFEWPVMGSKFDELTKDVPVVR